MVGKHGMEKIGTCCRKCALVKNVTDGYNNLYEKISYQVLYLGNLKVVMAVKLVSGRVRVGQFQI